MLAERTHAHTVRFHLEARRGKDAALFPSQCVVENARWIKPAQDSVAIELDGKLARRNRLTWGSAAPLTRGRTGHKPAASLFAPQVPAWGEVGPVELAAVS